MTRQVLIQSPYPNAKTRSLLVENEKPTKRTKLAKTTKTNRFGEMAGGTAAECAAVCCCCPCTVMNLLVLAIFKIPACLCRKAKKRHRLTKKREALLRSSDVNDMCRRDELEREVKAIVEKQKGKGINGTDDDRETEAVFFEKDMWDRFYATGFWRSPSQRSTM